MSDIYTTDEETRTVASKMILPYVVIPIVVKWIIIIGLSRWIRSLK